MKELELEAEKYARSFDKNIHGYNGESLSPEDEKQMQDFIAGATSKYVEKLKLDFAIEQLKYVKTQCYNVRQFNDDLLLGGKIKELEQKLSEL